MSSTSVVSENKPQSDAQYWVLQTVNDQNRMDKSNMLLKGGTIDGS